MKNLPHHIQKAKGIFYAMIFPLNYVKNIRQSRFLDESVNIARHCWFSSRRDWIVFCLRLLVRLN